MMSAGRGPLKKKSPVPHLVLAILLSLLLAACGSDSAATADAPLNGSGEVVAQLNDFTDYSQSLTAVDYNIGASSPALGTAHMGGDNAYSRTVWSSSPEVPADGVYPAGTILLKETFTWENGVKSYASAGGLMAMVKRGGDFNADFGGWEWFILSPDLTQIVDRGGENVMGGMCNGCHDNAGLSSDGDDYVFAHPLEVAAAASDFADYATWTQIADVSGANALLGMAHKADDPTAQRRIYSRSPLGNPDAALGGYPKGTMLVKEITQGGAVTEITAMVKRGGAFNPDNGNWEWFMLDPATLDIMDRGADLMMGMCNGCHAQALEADKGLDNVFKHEGDLFNNFAEAPAAPQLPTPDPAPAIDGAALFLANCNMCHFGNGIGSGGTDKTGKTAQEITDAIASIPMMSGFSSLSAEEIQAIAVALAP